MIDIFGSKVLSKLKKKDRKQPDCSQERGSWTKKYLPNRWFANGPVHLSLINRAMFSLKSEIIFIWLAAILIITDLVLTIMISNMLNYEMYGGNWTKNKSPRLRTCKSASVKSIWVIRYDSYRKSPRHTVWAILWYPRNLSHFQVRFECIYK